MAFWDNWSQRTKTAVVITAIALLVLAILFVSLFAVLKIKFDDYRKNCVPKEEHTACVSNLEQTKTNLESKQKDVDNLQSEKEALINETEQCQADLLRANKNYAELLDQYQKLNLNYSKLFLDYGSLKKELNECRTNLSQLPTNNQTMNVSPNEIYYRNSLVVVALMVFLSIPLNIGFNGGKPVKVINSFVGTFTASMLILSYIPFDGFWLKFFLSLTIGMIVAIIVYKNTE